MDEAKLQNVIDELIAAYVAKFGEQPDNVTGMVIRTVAERYASAESFEWFEEKGFRKLVRT